MVEEHQIILAVDDFAVRHTRRIAGDVCTRQKSTNTCRHRLHGARITPTANRHALRLIGEAATRQRQDSDMVDRRPPPEYGRIHMRCLWFNIPSRLGKAAVLNLRVKA